MTDENRFFRYLWRFNAMVVAIVGVAGAAVILGSFVNVWAPVEPAPPAGIFAPVPKNAEKEFTYRLQSNGERRVVGREELISLGRWKGSPETYGLARQSSSYVNETRSVNFLAINQVTAESHWVFNGYSRAIIANELIYEDLSSPALPVPGLSQPAIALAMVVVDADTNKDGELTGEDRQSLYVYREGNAGSMRLLTADLIVSRQQTAGDRYLVVYENGSSAVAATFSVPEFKLIAQKTLPKVPNG